jgi:hypothetical protein
MIKEITKKEIDACCGGVRLETRVHDCFSSSVLGGIAFGGIFAAWSLAGFVKTNIGYTIAGFVASVFFVATYRNYYGTTYTVDLDSTD